MAPSVDKQTPTKMVNIISNEQEPMEICTDLSENALFPYNDYMDEIYENSDQHSFCCHEMDDQLSEQSPALDSYDNRVYVTCRDKLATRPLVKSSHQQDSWYKTVMHRVLEGDIAINGGVDAIRQTPLQLTVRRADYEMMERLLNAGASADAHESTGKTALHIAAELGDVHAAEILLNDGAANPHALTERGFNSAVFAVQSGCTQLVKMLIDRRYFNVNALVEDRDVSRKFSLLHCAIECNDAMMVQLLLECRADVNQADSFGNSGLHLACRHGHSEIARLLLRHGARVHGQGSGQPSALSLAVENGHRGVFELLLSHGANLNERGCDGATALHCAVASDGLEFVRRLVQRGAQVDAANRHGQRPLHYAIVKRRRAALELLLEHGADVNGRDSLGKSPLHTAIEYGRGEVCALLLESGAGVNATDDLGQTPLHFAVKQGCGDTVELLLRHGADANARDAARQTPLHLVVRFGYMGLLELLLRYSVDVNAQDSNGYAPLHLAVLSEHVKLIYCDYSFTLFHELLRHGAEVRSRTALTGESPLHLAVKRRCSIFAKHLLSRGSDVDAIDNIDEKTPLRVAVENEDVECIEQLLTFGADVAKMLASGPKVSQDMMRVISRHFIRKLAAGMPVDPRYLTLVRKDSEFEKLCQDQVKKMKLTKIHNEQTYYDFLRGNRRSLVNLLSKDEICSVFQQDTRTNVPADESSALKANFPVFANMLERNYHIGVRYAPVLNAASDSLGYLLQLPTVPIERILDFLDDQDMCNVVQAVPVN